jgi:hypothetical protein
MMDPFDALRHFLGGIRAENNQHVESLPSYTKTDIGS